MQTSSLTTFEEHNVEGTLKDPYDPHYSELGYERLHPWNIKVIYQQLKKRSG